MILSPGKVNVVADHLEHRGHRWLVLIVTASNILKGAALGILLLLERICKGVAHLFILERDAGNHIQLRTVRNVIQHAGIKRRGPPIEAAWHTENEFPLPVKGASITNEFSSVAQS